MTVLFDVNVDMLMPLLSGAFPGGVPGGWAWVCLESHSRLAHYSQGQAFKTEPHSEVSLA